MRSLRFFLPALLAGVVAPAAYANLECISEEELRAGLRKTLALYEAKDIDGLRSLMKDAHLFVKARAALCLGRTSRSRLVYRSLRLMKLPRRRRRRNAFWPPSARR